MVGIAWNPDSFRTNELKLSYLLVLQSRHYEAIDLFKKNFCKGVCINDNLIFDFFIGGVKCDCFKYCKCSIET